MATKNDMRTLERYLRKSTASDLVKVLKFYLYLCFFVLLSTIATSPYPSLLITIMLPCLFLFGAWLYKRHETTTSLVAASEEFGAEQLLDDFCSAQPILGDRLRVGDEWLYGQCSLRPMRIVDITELRYEPAVSFVQGYLLVTLRNEVGEFKFCRFTSKTPFEDEIGGLVDYLLKINPNINVDSSLLDLAKREACLQMARKMASRTIRGRWGTCSWEIDAEGVLTVHKGIGAPCAGRSPWAKRSLQITAARFEPTVILPPDCNGLFTGCSSLVRIDDGSWNMSKVKTMKRMFCGCSSLKELSGARAWNTSQVKDMSCAFDGCSSLEKVFTATWDTSSVQDMTGLFWGCSSLRYLGLALWNTSRVEDMRGMFIGCASLVTAPVSSWDTSQVKNTSYMFKDCEALTELDLSHWNIEILEDAHGMLDGCDCLASINLPDQLATQLKNDHERPGSLAEASIENT